MILTGILTGILWDLYFFWDFWRLYVVLSGFLGSRWDSLGLFWIICDYFWDSEGSFWISGDSRSFFRDSFGISLGFFDVSGCQGLFRDLVGILWDCLGLSAILFGILRDLLGFLGFSVVLTGLFWDLVGILWDYLGLSAIRFGIFLDFKDSLSFFSIGIVMGSSRILYKSFGILWDSQGSAWILTIFCHCFRMLSGSPWDYLGSSRIFWNFWRSFWIFFRTLWYLVGLSAMLLGSLRIFRDPSGFSRFFWTSSAFLCYVSDCLSILDHFLLSLWYFCGLFTILVLFSGIVWLFYWFLKIPPPHFLVISVDDSLLSLIYLNFPCLFSWVLSDSLLFSTFFFIWKKFQTSKNPFGAIFDHFRGDSLGFSGSFEILWPLWTLWDRFIEMLEGNEPISRNLGWDFLGFFGFFGIFRIFWDSLAFLDTLISISGCLVSIYWNFGK